MSCDTTDSDGREAVARPDRGEHDQGEPQQHDKCGSDAAGPRGIGPLFPRLRPLLWIYAVTIAMSRVIISAHYPSDTIAGAAVGAFGAVLVREWFAARRLGFYAGCDGKVHVMPGPSFKRIKKVARSLFAA